MNTTKVGDEFESKGLDIIQRVIAEEQLGHIAKYLKIKPKAPYYSPLRKGNVIFDLVIEVWPPGATRYTLIYIIECKNYQRRVQVDKIKSFLFDVKDVGLANAKAIFITNSPLQKGGYNIADSAGMMVIEGESADDYRIVLHKTNPNKQADHIPIVFETINDLLMDTGVKLIEKLLDKQILDALFEDLNDKKVSYGIDKLTREMIEQLANDELDKMNPDILKRAFHISPKSLKEFMHNCYGIQTKSLPHGVLLGSCDFEGNQICVSKEIENTPRELFLLAHEFGHFILHDKLSIGQQQYEYFSESEYNFKTGKYDLNNPRNWIEWQANYFAACLVLPKVPLWFRLSASLENLGRPKGKIYVDDQYQNIQDFNEIIAKLAYRFSVSKTTVIYKLNELGWIENNSRVKMIGTLIDEYRVGLFT